MLYLYKNGIIAVIYFADVSAPHALLLVSSIISIVFAQIKNKNEFSM